MQDEAEHFAREPEAAPEPRRHEERPAAEAEPGEEVRHADLPARAAVGEGAHAGRDGARGARHQRGRVRVHPEMRQRRGQAAHQVEAAEEGAPPEVLEERPCQVEEEEVAEQVHPPEVQEHVRQPAGLQKAARRHQREAPQERAAGPRFVVGDERVEVDLLQVAGRLVEIRGRVLAQRIERLPPAGPQVAADELVVQREIGVLPVVLDDLARRLRRCALRVPGQYPGGDEHQHAEAGDADRDQRRAIDRRVLDPEREEHAIKCLA